ncbi:MAG TPA: hypothetical protein VF658_07300 [Pyrinomonadaceae bacterium]
MSKRLLSLSLAALLINLTGLSTPYAVAAQERERAGAAEKVNAGGGKQEKEAKSAAKVKEKVAEIGTGPRAKVEVKLRAGAKVKGYISEIASDSFTVVDKKTGAQTMAYSDVKSVKNQYIPKWMKISALVAMGLLVPVIISAVVVVAQGGQ